MNELSMSSSDRRSARRHSAGTPRGISSQGRPKRTNSLGRSSLQRQHSRRMSREPSFRSSVQDAFGDDVFDLDPSADFSAQSFFKSFDDIVSFPCDVDDDATPEKPMATPRPRKIKKSISLSQRDFRSRIFSQRQSLRASQRRLTSSMRNVNVPLDC